MNKPKFNRSLNVYLLTLLVAIFLTSCSDKKIHKEIDFHYVLNFEVLSHKALNVKIDNFKKTIEVLMENGQNFKNVKARLELAANVSLLQPKTAVFTCDLTSPVEIYLKKGDETIKFKLLLQLQSKPLKISSTHWEQQSQFGYLPDYISVYKYKKDIFGKSVKAYIAVADIGQGKGKFSVLGEKKGAFTPLQFYQQNASPKVLLNGGYFWAGTSLGLMIKNGKTISKAEPVVTRKYNGEDASYYPTTGAFGMESNGTFTAQWAYHSGDILYAYPNPAPNKAGEKPSPIPDKNYPQGAKSWQPREAIGAGPILIKDGEYKNLWENELFDDASGVGVNFNHPRSAAAYHPNGYVVFFVCEGRNKTPNTPGLSLKNVADLLLELGCTAAINLDGGGSSCMLINGKETIIPSDKNGQRAVTNALAIY